MQDNIEDSLVSISNKKYLLITIILVTFNSFTMHLCIKFFFLIFTGKICIQTSTAKETKIT